jgi:hypothetical protein
MKILSFDVGIKNLSYCAIEMIDKNLKIIDWQVIDLCNEKSKCIEIKDGKQCIKPAKYSKNNEFYCQSHSKKKMYEVPPDNLREKTLKKMKIDELKHIASELNIIVDKPFTKNKVLEKINEYKSTKYFDIISNLKASEYNLVELGINLRDRLDDILNLDNIDVVLIENQISPIANRMKTIQGLFFKYLIMRGIKNIIFYSASNKLKTFIGSDKTNYSERKQLSIDYTKQILTKNITLTESYDFFSSHKKRDDLADSFLQGLSYFIQKYNL